jgi:hypothetical protein
MTRTRAISLLLAFGLASPVEAQSLRYARGPAMLIHGNYCGMGNNAPLPPVDALDAACARHDACTPYNGLPSQACNRRFQREAAFIARDPRQPDDVRATAGLLAFGAGMIPFDPIVPAAVAYRPAY